MWLLPLSVLQYSLECSLDNPYEPICGYLKAPYPCLRFCLLFPGVSQVGRSFTADCAQYSRSSRNI